MTINQAWERLGKVLVLEEPKGNEPDVHTFLGCTHKLETKQHLSTSAQVRCITYDVSSQLRKAIARYEEVVWEMTGLEAYYPDSPTPFIEESTRSAPQRRPREDCDSYVECPCCLHTFSTREAVEERTWATNRPRSLRDALGVTPSLLSGDE